MTAYSNTAEGGTNGTTVTTGNSGGASGDAWDSVIGSGTIVFDNTHPAHGSMGYRCSSGATTAQAEPLKTFPSATTTAAFRCYYYFTANPAATVRIGGFRSGTTNRLILAINSSGQILVLNSTGSTLYTFTTTIPLNAQFRVEVVATNLDATNGACQAWLYLTPDSSTADETSGALTSRNLGGSADRYVVGIVTTLANVVAFYFDDVAGNDTGAAIGPAVTNTNVTGSQATTTSTGLAGTPAVAPAGQQATTTSTGLAGTPTVAPQGQQAATTVTANAGTVTVTVQGSQAVVTSSGIPGTVTATVTGTQAVETSTGLDGTNLTAATAQGSQATETSTALAGTPAASVTGSQATETDSGQAGTTSGATTVNGSQALDTSTAAHGSPAVTVTGQQPATADTGRAGTPALHTPGAQASETDTAFAGIIAANYQGSQAVETDTAQAGTVASAVPIVPGTLTSASVTEPPLTASDHSAAELVGSDS